jgi:hypothetical protein
MPRVVRGLPAARAGPPMRQKPFAAVNHYGTPRVQRPLPEAEEPRARPAGAGDLPCDHGEGAVALTAPLDAVGMDEDHMGDPAPFPHEPRARLQRDRRRGYNRAAARRTGGGLLQLPGGGLREAAVRPLLRLCT